MDGFPVKGKPPHNVSVLERWLTEASKETGVAAGRLRRWLGFMVVAAMLDEARHAEDGEPLFLVKGGVAMELRIDSGARATKDFDTAFRASMEAVADHLDPALRAGHGDFTATRTELEPVKDTGAARCEIKLAYRGKSVITVKMDVAAVEGGMGDEIDHVSAKSLDHVGLAGPDTVPCVAVRAACIEVFESRAKQGWPPQVTLYESWAPGYEALAVETGFAITDVREASDAVAELIERIDQATT